MELRESESILAEFKNILNLHLTKNKFYDSSDDINFLSIQ